MATIAVLHNLARPSMGYASDGLHDAGIEVAEYDLRGGDAGPDLTVVDGVLALGGEHSAVDLDQHEYLAEEVELIRATIDAEIPFLGVCLGGQLLARALRTRVWRMDAPMIGWYPLSPLQQAEDDPIFRGWSPGLTVDWHEDAFELPDGAIELFGRSGPGVEAMRFGGHTWGVQFHPEADSEMLDSWCRDARTGQLEAAGVDEKELRHEIASNIEAHRIAGIQLFRAFGEHVERRARERLNA